MNGSADKVRKEVGEPDRKRLVRRVREVNHHIATRGIRSYRGHADLIMGYSYGEFYDWDLYFENIYMSYFGVSRSCRANLEAFLDRQLACGFVSRSLIHPRDRQHFKPFLAQIALLGARQDGRFDWLSGRYYIRLKKYLDYWQWYCDFDRNGLSVWDSADHSGMDNQDSRAGSIFSMTTEGADLNAYIVRELQAMAVIADHLEAPDEAEAFRREAAQLGERINAILWDERDGFYYDRHERRNELVRVKSIGGFLPMWAGIAPPERSRRLVQEPLLNEAACHERYPIASYARTEPDSYQQRVGGECNWRGTSWVPTNYMVFHGLCNAGFDDVARQVAHRTFEMALREETTREFYDGETGVGQGLNPFWGWSALAYFMPLEYEMSYDPEDLSTEDIRPLGVECLGIKFPMPTPPFEPPRP